MYLIWRHLGFDRDIFFVDPLKPNAEDIKLFVGRENEIKRYLIDTLSGAHALKIVSGEIGVGKTTFVNACQYYSYIGQVPSDFKFPLPQLLPCFEKIQIRENEEIDAFFLHAVTSLCQNIVFHCKLHNIDPPKAAKEILDVFLELTINSGGSGFAIGGSLSAMGAQIGVSRGSVAQNIISNPKIHLRRLIEIIVNELKLSGAFITVNNLDILSKDRLIKFLNVARDEAFDIDGIYWTLIGRRGIGSIIETEVERVADYLSGTELCIPAATFDETKKIIQARVENFRLPNRADAKCPINDNAIEMIHFMSLKETRETLKICGEIARRIISVDPSYLVIPDDIVARAFITYAQERARDINLTEANKKVLMAVYEKSHCRPKDYAKFDYASQPAFSSALKALVTKRLLSVEEKGTARIYRMTGMTILAALTGALGQEIENIAKNSMEDFRFGGDKKSHALEEGQLSLELE